MQTFTKRQLLSMCMDSLTTKIVMKIDKACAGKFNSKNKKLGFDWSFLRHNAGIADLLKSLQREIKWGFQRFAHGYDDQMFWGLDSYLDELIMISLEWYIENRTGSPVIDDWTEENCHEKWTGELKKMLFHFEQSDDRWCREKNEYANIVDLESYSKPSGKKGFVTMEYKDKSTGAEELREKWHQRCREIDAYQAEHHKKALELLVKYYKNLWD